MSNNSFCITCLFTFSLPYNKYVSERDWRTSTHADPTESLARSLRQHISTVMFTSRWAWPARWPIRPILGFWGKKFTKICDSLPWTPINRWAKSDAASFILSGEIRIGTNEQTNSKRYIHIPHLAYRHVWIKMYLHDICVNVYSWLLHNNCPLYSCESKSIEHVD